MAKTKIKTPQPPQVGNNRKLTKLAREASLRTYTALERQRQKDILGKLRSQNHMLTKPEQEALNSAQEAAKAAEEMKLLDFVKNAVENAVQIATEKTNLELKKLQDELLDRQNVIGCPLCRFQHVASQHHKHMVETHEPAKKKRKLIGKKCNQYVLNSRYAECDIVHWPM
jgi:acylphosphatase